jgi:uncharacterized protein YraI
MIPLEEGGELALFSVAFNDVDEQSSISIQIHLQEQEPIASQITFLQNNFNPETDAVAGTVTTALRIRNGPGTDFDPPIGKLAKGKQVTLLGWALDTEGKRWWYVRPKDGKEGWVFALYVEAEKSTACIPEKLDYSRS